MHRQMHRPALVRFALGIGALMVVILALAACGSGSAQEEPKARPLPLYRHDLRPGEYHSVKFKPPLSFKVGKGWEKRRRAVVRHYRYGAARMRAADRGSNL
jgi:hypothetical protein